LTYSRSTKVLSTVDVECVSGVVATGRETASGWPAGAAKGNDYGRARLDACGCQRAIWGAVERGATEIIVADAHDGMAINRYTARRLAQTTDQERIRTDRRAA
jgi:D-aminopeptidase